MHVCSYGRGPNPQPFRQKFGQPAACRRPNSESALAHASANSIGPREIFWLQDPKAVDGGRPSAVLMLASSPTRGSHCAGHLGKVGVVFGWIGGAERRADVREGRGVSISGGRAGPVGRGWGFRRCWGAGCCCRRYWCSARRRIGRPWPPPEPCTPRSPSARPARGIRAGASTRPTRAAASSATA